jgi:predicted RNA-binding Zn-ribbon protein involved in translation (DUF1610 family)
MQKLRFIIGLLAGKFFLFMFKHTGHERDDRPGMAAMRICDDFLKYVAKPKLTVVVTGTNGKTTISSLITDILRMQGKTVSFNDWGANHRAGQARCLLDAVSIFNRPKKDAAVIEADELTSPLDVPLIAPNYIIVNNLARDSMRRNAHPEYIFSQLEKAISGSPGSTVILNADDPISSFLGENGANRRIYFGVSDQHTEPFETNINDFAVCPVCGAKPVYNYRNYRHLGDFYCPECGLKSKNRDYFATGIDYENRRMTLREPDGERTYPIISDTLHNAYNVAAVITMFRDMGTPYDEICRCLKEVRVPASRESWDEAMGIKLITYVAKGQNVSAASTVFEYLAKEPSKKELILLLDEVFDDPRKTETVTWIYESDFEFLKNDNIKKIIMGGERYLDYRLRLLLAGIPEEKIVCVRDEYDTPNYVDTDGIDKIYVLHDVDSITKGRKIRNAVKERILSERGGK